MDEPIWIPPSAEEMAVAEAVRVLIAAGYRVVLEKDSVVTFTEEEAEA